MTLVKVCGLTTVPDAVEVARAGADLIGVNIWPGSPRSVTVERAREIFRAVRALGAEGPRLVLLDVSPDPVLLRERVLALVPDMVQIVGAWAGQGEFAGIPVLRAFAVGSRADLASLAVWSADPVLLDARVAGKAGGTGVRIDEDLLVGLARPYFLAGGLTPDNVAAAVARLKPYGVDVASGVESSPGVKDMRKVRAFLAEVKRKT